MFALFAQEPPPSARMTATSKGVAREYHTRALRGFTVHVDARLESERADAGEAALAVLDSQLLQIARRLRDAPLAQLRAIPIWLSLDDPVAPCACYHESPDWLRQNGFDPQKAKAVEIAHAETFVQWTLEQPWMVLHELAHGYDDRFLDASVEGASGDAGRELDALFAKAKASGRYDRVLHWNAAHVRHYALENSGEYFAESTEAWLGTNDFFPFVNAELREADPEMAAFLTKVWGEPVNSARPR
jgi:hypothetical protein